MTDLPPHDDAAEQALLGAMLQSAPAVTTAITHLRAADLYRPHHQLIYTAIVETDTWGDPILTAHELQKRGHLTKTGGAPYLHTCIATCPAGGPDTVTHYAKIIKEHAQTRNRVETALRLHNAATDPDTWTKLLQTAAEHLDHPNGGPPDNQHPPVNWQNLLEQPPQPPRWLPGRLLAHGEHIALVGEGKAGKSLLALELAWRAANTAPFLGDISREPLRILYIDQENGPDLLRDRLNTLGAKAADLTNLTYLMFPPFAPLDTPVGAQALHNAVHTHNPDLIILDTASRMIAGPENDADTWLALYRLTLLPLKAAGRASIRLDHFGKDTTRGSRGSSAKTQDVDHVWELTSDGGGYLSLTRTHTRTGLGPDQFFIHRQGHREASGAWAHGVTRHVLSTADPADMAAHDIARRLDQAGISRDASRDAVREACKQLGLKVRNETLGAIVRFRHDQSERY